jgi:hypothetical protein
LDFVSVEYFERAQWSVHATLGSQRAITRGICYSIVRNRIENYHLTGLHRPIAIRGGQPDDVIVVTFDIRHASAEIRFGEEIGSGNEAITNATTPDSLATTAINQDQTPLITDHDLTGDGKEWHPIITAPAERDLEVRLEDPFGRYVLLFPCKFLPGQGWINSRLETPLPADPVDWRHWDESSIRF